MGTLSMRSEVANLSRQWAGSKFDLFLLHLSLLLSHFSRLSLTLPPPFLRLMFGEEDDMPPPPSAAAPAPVPMDVVA